MNLFPQIIDYKKIFKMEKKENYNVNCEVIHVKEKVRKLIKCNAILRRKTDK